MDEVVLEFEVVLVFKNFMVVVKILEFGICEI